MLCLRAPCPDGSVPDKPFDVSIETSPFPSVSPWAFLAQAIGNVAGSIVGAQRGEQQSQQAPVVQQMPDFVEMMQREETNRLIRELLKSSKEKKDTFTLERDIRKPDILSNVGDPFGFS